MGRPVSRNLEDELMTKIKMLFDGILDSVNKENPSYTFDFEQFVDCFDVNDHFFKRIFEFLVKETALRYRSVHPYSANPPLPRPHTIHHIAGEHTDISNNTNTNTNETSATQSSHRHHNHHQSQRLSQLSRHTLPALERDSSPRPPSRTSDSPVPSEGPSSVSSSGAALRYLLANQGLSQSGSRRRMAHRLLSNDLFAYQQGQPSLLSSVSAVTSPAAAAEATSAQSRGSRQSRTRPDMSGLIIPVASSETAATAATAVTSTATSTAASMRRSLRRGDTLERQRAFVLRPHSRSEIASMESAPESFGTEDWSASPSAAFSSEVFDPVSGELYSARPGSPERRLVERHIQEQLLQAQELRHQHMRQLYIQTLHARGRPRHLPPTQPEQTQPEQTQPEQTQQQRRHALQTLQGERPPLSEDAQQQQSMQEDQQQPQQPQEQQQQQPQYPLRDNGLMLVQLYPTSPSTPTPASSMTSEGAADGGASHSASSLSTLSRANGLLEERYREFSDSTQRGRAAMRNALAANLHIEEDHQVLLTGEVSRRRRRRVHGRFSHPSESPDIASDNSSAIISQLQQQQPQHEHTQLNEQDQTQARSTVLDQIPLESFETPLSEPVVENALDSQHVSEDSTEMGGNAGSLVAPSEDSQTTTTAPSVPVVSVELASGSDGNNTGGASLQGNSDGGSGGNLDSRTNTEGPAQGSTHPQHSVPLTPPSPNPNRNPMPTFTDRRRSSINPADIEAVVREMEANVQSEMARIASRALPFSTTFGSRGGSLLTRTAALDSSHDDTATVEETETSRRESQPPLPASGQVGQRDAQPLPSPPQTEPESGVVSGEIESPSLH